jgi:hypothetical protein
LPAHGRTADESAGLIAAALSWLRSAVNRRNGSNSPVTASAGTIWRGDSGFTHQWQLYCSGIRLWLYRRAGRPDC